MTPNGGLLDCCEYFVPSYPVLFGYRRAPAALPWGRGSIDLGLGGLCIQHFLLIPYSPSLVVLSVRLHRSDGQTAVAVVVVSPSAAKLVLMLFLFVLSRFLLVRYTQEPLDRSSHASEIHTSIIVIDEILLKFLCQVPCSKSLYSWF